MATIEEFKAWVARDLNYKTTDICDSVEVVEQSGQGSIGGVAHEELAIRIYTANNWYHLRVSQHTNEDGDISGYLGCEASSRIPRAGEDHHRGNDLPDGMLTEETWQRILAAIVSYEMVKVHHRPLGASGNRWSQNVIEQEVRPRKPRIGDTVVYFQPTKDHEGNPVKKSNGHRDHPAIVTAVWSDGCVNLKVFFDCSPVADETSVNLRDTPDDTSNPYRYWEWPK